MTLSVVAVLILVVIGPRIIGIFGDTWDEYVVNAAARDRYDLYRGGFDLAVRSPIVGRGPGTFGSYASVLFHSSAYAELGIRLPDSLKTGAPYASLLGEFGIAGVIAFGTFVALTIRALLPAARSPHATVVRAVASAAFVLVVDMTLESVVHVTFSDSLGSFIAFGSAGAAIRLWGTAGEESAPAPAPEPRWFLASLLGAGLLMLGLIGLVGWLKG